MRLILKVDVHIDTNKQVVVFTEAGSDLDIGRSQFVVSFTTLKAVLAQLLLSEVNAHQQAEQIKPH